MQSALTWLESARRRGLAEPWQKWEHGDLGRGEWLREESGTGQQEKGKEQHESQSACSLGGQMKARGIWGRVGENHLGGLHDRQVDILLKECSYGHGET